MSKTLTKTQARHVIEVVGSSGVPPEWGFQYFSAGLEPYIDVLEKDYLQSLVKDGGSSFKVVVGSYGGGKTHFLYSVRDLAFKHEYLVSYCPLSLNDSPFYRLDLVYRAVVSNIMRPVSPPDLMSGAERGPAPFLKSVFQDLVDGLIADGMSGPALKARLKTVFEDVSAGLEDPNFGIAVRQGLDALVEGDRDRLDLVLQYLLADGYDRAAHKRLGILHPIDKGHAFPALRSLVAFIRNLKFRGLVILFDEAEQAGSMSPRQKEMMLANLREMVDQCGSAAFSNVMVFYAVPDEHFLTEGRSTAYEALKQRIHTVFDFNNPTGVTIRLDRIGRTPRTLMIEIGMRLAAVYEKAWGVNFPLETRSDAVAAVADAVAERAYGDIGYKRLFVQSMVRAFNTLRLDPGVTLGPDFASAILDPGDGGGSGSGTESTADE
ncbi:MAG: hypothetical protein GXP54_08235 [Deltaproteobacteria bacterium]|nr:hypothetical protein [Deltaproteobacteria bacterium]